MIKQTQEEFLELLTKRGAPPLRLTLPTNNGCFRYTVVGVSGGYIHMSRQDLLDPEAVPTVVKEGWSYLQQRATLATDIQIEVVAGKYDDGELNCKFLHGAASLEDALTLLQYVSDMPWSHVEITGPDGRRYELTEMAEGL